MGSCKGEFYFAYGYNKNWYSRTNVRIHGDNGKTDFTLYKMKAHDRTHFKDLFKVQPSIPQYGYSIGYWMPRKGILGNFGFELKFDHAKYIVDDYQRVWMEGKVDDNSYSTDTLVDPINFLHLEHTDGANFLMFNVMWRHYFIELKKFRLFGFVKAGAGIVIPRTDVTLFGQRWNHCFHVAGQVAGMESGFRGQIGNIFFFDLSAKGVYCNFKNVLAVNPYMISHAFWDGMVLFDIGANFQLGRAGRLRHKQPVREI
ncbi:MAG TPA: hypothetical protein VI731_06290 [Bacteroidia bacterium]|nr:hypothetical protein [Bacteroidia bacterium]